MARLRLADDDNLSPSGNVRKRPVLKSLLQISFLGGSQDSPACLSAKSSMSMKMSMEHRRNETDFKNQEKLELCLNTINTLRLGYEK